jgi:hypothetical protein
MLHQKNLNFDYNISVFVIYKSQKIGKKIQKNKNKNHC